VTMAPTTAAVPAAAPAVCTQVTIAGDKASATLSWTPGSTTTRLMIHAVGQEPQEVDIPAELLGAIKTQLFERSLCVGGRA
jgi:hypothetical protein